MEYVALDYEAIKLEKGRIRWRLINIAKGLAGMGIRPAILVSSDKVEEAEIFVNRAHLDDPRFCFVVWDREETNPVPALHMHCGKNPGLGKVNVQADQEKLFRFLVEPPDEDSSV